MIGGTSWFRSTAFAPLTLVSTSTRESALRGVLCSIEGVGDVRVLPAAARAPGSRDKVYVILDTHDVRRDRRIVEVLCQLDDIDFDLVPSEAQGMIPNGAAPLRSLS